MILNRLIRMYRKPNLPESLIRPTAGIVRKIPVVHKKSRRSFSSERRLICF